MVFLLDNYDSFTYNLWQYLAELGEPPEVARNDEITVDEVLRRKPSAIVLSPGPGRPEHAGILQELIREAASSVPLLGVCLGHQGIGQVFGGRIDYAPSLMHGKTSPVRHNRSLLFDGVEDPFTATRYHSLVIAPDSLPDVFEKTAWTNDGVLMGIQHTSMPLYGVQFHPESIMTVAGKSILKNFLRSTSQ
ncbi:anthranilate/aminodeoxychorismate synthase component II [candidate division GN15 bacterium]|nr:anthranilate/aminodeoxychorismate synthase component II [candidate division GN15 bacterium]